jgi:hypothetical protein
MYLEQVVLLETDHVLEESLRRVEVLLDVEVHTSEVREQAQSLLLLGLVNVSTTFLIILLVIVLTAVIEVKSLVTKSIAIIFLLTKIVSWEFAILSMFPRILLLLTLRQEEPIFLPRGSYTLLLQASSIRLLLLPLNGLLTTSLGRVTLFILNSCSILGLPSRRDGHLMDKGPIAPALL